VLAFLVAAAGGIGVLLFLLWWTILHLGDP
jgi:hypothetical protein